MTEGGGCLSDHSQLANSECNKRPFFSCLYEYQFVKLADFEFSVGKFGQASQPLCKNGLARLAYEMSAIYAMQLCMELV